VIASAGDFGREVLDIVEAANTVDPIFALLGYVDNSDNPNLELLTPRGPAFLDAIDALARIDADFVVGIG
jgi:hypothetical protein